MRTFRKTLKTMDGNWLRKFLVPEFNRAFWVRLLAVSLSVFVVCRFILTPAFTNGESMVPTYGSGRFVLLWRPVYWFRNPRVGEVVAVRYKGEKVMFFKRVVATEGQVVEFRRGRLYVDGHKADQDWNYLTQCDWELPPRVVPPGHVYLVGDNRAMPMEQHIFGHTSISRIVGKAL